MKTSDKVLLCMLALMNYAVAAFVILSEFVLENFRPLDGILKFSLHNDKLDTACFIFVIIFTLTIGTSLLSIVARSRRYMLTKREDTVLLDSDQTGSSEITFDAIRAMTKKKCMTFRFVADCVTDVNFAKDGSLRLYVKIKPYPDTSLKDAIKEMKEELSKSVNQQTGLTVNYIKVLVLPYKARKQQ